MANIDLKQAATKGYVEGDEYLTKDSSGGLNWTPAHEAPYELLEDDIISKTNTKGLVSGWQLSELIPDIPELTQANIDDKDDISGTVNPSKVTLGGGGGPEVLKDWTESSSKLIDITADTIGVRLDDVVVEIEDAEGGGIGIKFTNDDGSEPMTTTNNGGGNIPIPVFTFTQILMAGRATISFKELDTVVAGNVASRSVAIIESVSMDFTQNKITKYATANAAWNGYPDTNPPRKVALVGLDGVYASVTRDFKTKYRIIRK